MPHLRRSDLDAALAFLAEASDVDGPEPFTTELLDRLLELVPYDAATSMEIDLVSGVVGAYVPCSAERPTPDKTCRGLSRRRTATGSGARRPAHGAVERAGPPVWRCAPTQSTAAVECSTSVSAGWSTTPASQ